MSDEPFAEPDREAELALWREATAAESAKPAANPDQDNAGALLPESRPVWIEQANAAGVEGWTVLDEAGNSVWIEGTGGALAPAAK